MKATIKIFACAVAISAVLLACGDTGVNNNAEQKDDPISSSSSVLISSSSSDEDDSEGIPSIISSDLKAWMEKLLNDRELIYVIHVIDLLAPEYEYDEAYEVWFGDGGICSQMKLYHGLQLDYMGEYIEGWLEKYRKERAEKRRVSPMIGEFVGDIYCRDTDGWSAAMTAEEILELTEKYKGLIVGFLWEYTYPISSSSSELQLPVMNSRVVSYQKDNAIGTEYTKQLGSEWYGNGIITDKETLKLWFPHIFNDEQTESQCNYFALYFTGSSSGLGTCYEILSQDMTLYRIECTLDLPRFETGDFRRRSMLICDDKDWTLKKSINLDSWQFIGDPNWYCESGKGGPDWEKIYF